ncbi:hypothetical protein CJU90_4538 [Yarrowia sp. C11]|nr:hypothetical protein CJU90_4538 [Yarrowia sp. C11]KAG5370487.1 hypothetical protein CKK34_0587 [Yarrowia sp. E02]
MTTFKISKYIYLHKNSPTPQGLVSSGIDRDASEWSKYPNSPLQLTIDTSSPGAKISLKYQDTALEYLDTAEIEQKFGSTYGKNNPPLVAICRQPGIGFKYLFRRFHTMTYRFQIKFASLDEYERAVELLYKAGLNVKGKLPASIQVDATQDAFKDFNPESQWNADDDDDGDLTQIDPFLKSQTPHSQTTASEPLFLSQTLVGTPPPSQKPYQTEYSHPLRPPSSSQPIQPLRSSSSSQLNQPKRFSETSTWKRTAEELSSLEASPVNSPPNSPRRAKSWKKHFTPADTNVRTENGTVSRGTQTEDPEWLTDAKAMETHIVDVVQNPLFDQYVARIKELMKGEQ